MGIRRRNVRLHVVVGATLLFSAVAVDVPASAGSNFHGYSTASENSALGQYTGIRVTRLDRAVSSQPATGCTQLFSGDPVYQTQWLIITDDAANWLELGTGHQCNDAIRYWFWGVGYLGGWFPLGTQLNITNGESHRFAIRKTGSNTLWLIDGVTKETQPASTGRYISTGLESYSGAAGVNTYTHNTLQRTTNGSQTWVDWAGFDASSVTGAGMCGGWNSATSWRAAENHAC
jgi:hypothetical protein